MTHTVASWPGNCLSPPKFWAVGKLSADLFLVTFLSRNAKFETGKLPFWTNLEAKLKFRALMISSVGNWQLPGNSVGNSLQLPVLPKPLV